MKFLHALTIFATVGLALAREFFLKFGIHADYSTIGAIGLGITTLLIFRSILSVLGVALLCVLISLSPEMLESVRLDRDMLLAAVIIVILSPWIYKIIKDS